MSDLASEITLQNHQYISLIVRLTLDQGGHLIQGELVDTTDTLRQRFKTLSGLNDAIAAWLKQQEQTADKQHKNTLTSNL